MYFWTMNLHAPMLASEDQYITWYVDNGIGTNGGYISTVHAKITTTERRELWDSLTSLNAQVDGPWFYKGDFIIILEPGEKRGGIPNRAYKSFDFVTCMNDCGVKDAGFVGSNFTWCNNRRPSKRIWKRLDRILINDSWLHKFQNIIVRYSIEHA